MLNMRCMRSAKRAVSFCACSTEISGVFIRPPCMYCSLNSSSCGSSFVGSSQQHTFSICGMKPSRMAVFDTLKQVWNIASTIGSLAA